MEAQQHTEGVNPYHVPPHLRRPHECYETEVLRRIWDRLNRRNEHFMGAIVGEEGSGKSYTAIRIASEIDRSFSHERVLFDVEDLLRILKNDEHEPGNAYVLDEAGVAFGNRTWQERGQILANQALQLIRNHNLALIFTLPRLGELDSQTQGRLQSFFEIIDKEPNEYVIGKWKYLDPDRTDETGKIYKKFPRVFRDGHRVRVTSLKFAPPDESLVEPYEEAKQEFQDRVYERTIDELSEDEASNSEPKKTPEEWADELIEERMEDVVSIHGGNGTPYVDHQLVGVATGLSVRKSKAVKKLIEREVDDLADYTPT